MSKFRNIVLPPFFGPYVERLLRQGDVVNRVRLLRAGDKQYGKSQSDNNHKTKKEVVESFSIKLKDTITDADKTIKNTVIASGVTQEFATNVNPGSALLQLNVGQ